MKFHPVILALVLVTACSIKVSPPGGETTKPGTERSFLPQNVDLVDTTLKGDLKSICDALEEKELKLDDYDADDFVMSSTFQETDCEGKQLSRTGHDVMVTRDGGSYIFQNATKNYPMPEIETRNSGVMKEICAGLATLENPMRASAGSSTAIEFETKKGISECPSNSQNVCLLVMKGRISDATQTYTISESTLVSFETVRGGRVGFYSYKSEMSYGTCSGNKFRTKTVRF